VADTGNRPLIIGGSVALVVLAGMAAAAYTKRRQIENVGRTSVDAIEDWMETLFRKTSEHEGTFWSVQRNLDGQGVSYGFIQWTQIAGGLSKVLERMRAANPAKFDEVFGGPTAAAHLLDAARAKSMAPVDGANLWDEPWLSRFVKAGHIPEFQQAQRVEAGNSEYMKAAKEIARLLGVKTERAMTMYYNRAVHQGAEGALGPARALSAWYAADPSRRPANPNDVLAQYAWRAAAKFRKIGAPADLNYNQRGLVWKPVTTEYAELSQGDYAKSKAKVAAPAGTYHVFAGGFPVSLYDLITMRSAGILTDPSLRDVDVSLDVAPPTVGAVSAPAATQTPAVAALSSWRAQMQREHLPLDASLWAEGGTVGAVITLDESEVGSDSNAAAKRALGVATRYATERGVVAGCVTIAYGVYFMWFSPQVPTDAVLRALVTQANR